MRVLERTGPDARTRSLSRSVAVAVALGVSAAPRALVVAYGVIALATVPTWVALTFVVDRLGASARPVGVRNVGDDLESRHVYAAVQRARVGGPYVLLGLEWLGAAALAVAMHTPHPVPVAAAAAVVAPGAMVGFLGVFGVWWLRRRRRAPGDQEALIDELTAYAPNAIVYMSAGAGHSQYMLNQWLPAFHAMDKRAMIVVRERNNITPIAPTHLPVVYAPRTRDVERLVLPSVKLAFYLANSGTNVHLQREAGVRHIFLNHGDSDKSTSANPVSRVYDEVWVAGPAAIDRYAAAGIDIPLQRFAVVGRPQVDGLTVGPRRADGIRRLLYAPTFEGKYDDANYSSLETMGVALVRTILDTHADLGIIFKPHPATGRHRSGMRAAMAQVTRLLHDAANAEQHVVAIGDDAPKLYDCFEMADVLVSDISSVVTDFLHTERPILVSNPRGLNRGDFVRMFPTQGASYLVDPDLGGLAAALAEALGPDRLAGERRATKRYVLGDLPHGPLQAFAHQVDRAYAAAVERAGHVRNAFTFGGGQPVDDGTGRAYEDAG
jgi:hypothetical protein